MVFQDSAKGLEKLVSDQNLDFKSVTFSNFKIILAIGRLINLIFSFFSLIEVDIASLDDDIIEKLHLLQAKRIASEGKYISFDTIICDLLTNEL